MGEEKELFEYNLYLFLRLDLKEKINKLTPKIII